MVSFALQEAILFKRAQMFTGILSLDDESLEKELPLVFLRYLGVTV